MKKSRVVIVMPAYNAEKTIKDTVDEIPRQFKKNIILVDDGSSDKTIKVARKLGIRAFSHLRNLGYGGNQKTCYLRALKLNPDIIVMLHPDYQYDATLIKELIRPIEQGQFDCMFGSRIRNRGAALRGGMPKIKYFVNRGVCIIENILLGVNFTEHFSGFRAYSRKVLQVIPFNHFSNDFVFDQQMIISALSYYFRVGEISVPTRYHDKASSIQFIRGTKFILETFWNIFIFKLHKKGFIKSKLFNENFHF